MCKLMRTLSSLLRFFLPEDLGLAPVYAHFYMNSAVQKCNIRNLCAFLRILMGILAPV